MKCSVNNNRNEPWDGDMRMFYEGEGADPVSIVDVGCGREEGFLYIDRHSRCERNIMCLPARIASDYAACTLTYEGQNMKGNQRQEQRKFVPKTQA